MLFNEQVQFPPLTANNCSIRCSYKFILDRISLFYSLESKIWYPGMCYGLEAFTTLAAGTVVVFFFQICSFLCRFVCFTVKTFPNPFGWCGKPVVTYMYPLVSGL